MKQKPYILTIAGFDPSSGAGITSDIKTFEAHDLYGLSVCTAITIQNDITLKDCIWMDRTVILSQIETLFERFFISTVKIGIVQSWKLLEEIINVLYKLNPTIAIVLDPILKASSGFNFHPSSDLEILSNVLEKCDFVTPNYNEIKSLLPNKNVDQTIAFISTKTNVYLKGGHRTDKKGWDEIYHSGIVQINIEPEVDKIHDKHGSGCVLSSALASNLSKGILLEDACRNAKRYTEQFLNSNDTLLGNHNYNTNDK